ncbi:MAG: hypothetical protein IT379_07130 [Deltaproteobacteria bacterium]|nr:hypothetical protein [Deltaproteobacteria bacterium]
MRWPLLLSAVAAVLAVGCGDDDGGGTDTGPPPPPPDGGRDMGDMGEEPDMGEPDMDVPPPDMGPDAADMMVPPPDMDVPPPPDEPPETVTMVADSGFSSPLDAVMSPDGATIYFIGFDENLLPSIFSVASGGGAVRILHSGAPLEAPTGLVLDCTGDTLYVADQGAEIMGSDGAVFSVPVAGGGPTSLGVTGMGGPNAIAFDTACTTLYLSGRDATGAGGVFTVAIAGGAATAVHAGAPLVAPTGLHVDDDGTVWLLDHLANGMAGQGVLYSIEAGGTPEEITSGLRLGSPGGVSLTAGGGFAVIANRGAMGGQLSVIDLAAPAAPTIVTSTMLDPAGLRVARSAGTFAIADSEGDAIFRAE